MTKEELFKNLDKNKYNYETKMDHTIINKGYDYTISVLKKMKMMNGVVESYLFILE